MLPSRKKTKRVSVKEALELLAQQEAQNLLDNDEIKREAIERVEQTGSSSSTRSTRWRAGLRPGA